MVVKWPNTKVVSFFFRTDFTLKFFWTSNSEKTKKNERTTLSVTNELIIANIESSVKAFCYYAFFYIGIIVLKSNGKAVAN